MMDVRAVKYLSPGLGSYVFDSQLKCSGQYMLLLFVCKKVSFNLFLTEKLHHLKFKNVDWLSSFIPIFLCIASPTYIKSRDEPILPAKFLEK